MSDTATTRMNLKFSRMNGHSREVLNVKMDLTSEYAGDDESEEFETFLTQVQDPLIRALVDGGWSYRGWTRPRSTDGGGGPEFMT